MNVKQLSEVAGVSRQTIGRVAKRLFPGKIVPGVMTTFTKEECFDIMRNTNKKHDVEIDGPAQPAQQNVEVDYKIIGEMIGAAITAAIKPMVNELKQISQPALPAPIKEDYFSLVAYFQRNGLTANRSELAMHGRELKKIARAKGLEVKKIPDERWGTVNSYPVEILDEYFAV